MSTVTNPLSGLIEGLLQGHAIAQQMHQQQQQDQAFKTNQALHDQQMSMQDIMNRQMLNESARPISGAGTIENPAVSAPDPTPNIPGMPAGSDVPALPAYQRKADASRTVKYGGQSYELKTPEEQQQGALNRQVNTNKTLEEAKYEQARREAMATRQSTLALYGGGTPAHGFASVGYPDGMMLAPPEVRDAKAALNGDVEAQQKIRAANEIKLAPGETLYQRPGTQAPGTAAPDSLGVGTPWNPGQPGAQAAPATPGNPTVGTQAPGTTGTMQPIATGGVAPPTGEFGAYLRAAAMKAGFTLQNAPPDVVMKATTDYALKAKSPEDMEQARAMRGLTMQLTQAHLDDLRTKNNTTPMPINPGTREYRVAQDLAYGKLTMQQFRSLTAYSRDTNKKMDIYDKAGELNPNFNPAQFEMGFNLAKNPKVQQQLASLDNVKQGIPDLLKFSDAASRSGAPLLNKFILPGGVSMGGKKYSDFKTAQIAFADELSGALGYGSATDMSREMGFSMTNPNLSPEQFSSAVQNVIQPFMERKRGTLLNQMGIYGQPGMNPAAGAAAPAAAPAASGTVRVKRKSDGMTGSVDAKDFDPAKYDKVQ
jgi:hypothetical protein